MIRALLIDDEPPARDLLRRLLTVHAGEVEIVGEARSVPDAAAKCVQLRPDLLFLDVHMPREDGFALLPLLAPPLPAIIFVTAFDHYAVRAFEVNALDYLLKPVSPARLARALARATASAPLPVTAGSALQADDLIFLRSDQCVRSAPVSSLTHIEAVENYTRVHFIEAPPLLIRRTMTEWESILPAPLFARVERSLFINLNAVRHLEIVSRDEARAHLSGRREPLLLARRASLRLRQALDAAQR